MWSASGRRWLLFALAVVGSACLSSALRASDQEKLDLPESRGSLLDSNAQDRGPRYREAAALEVRRRTEAARNEKARLGSRHWAGEYYSGDGLGVNQYLYLAPEAGFAFEWHGCLGLYDRNWGKVVQQGDTLLLEPALPNDQRGFSGFPERFRWLQWGEKTYLLPGDTVAAFCNGLNGEGRAWGWLEYGDLDLPDPPRHLLREDVRRCLLPAPLQATITATDVGPLQRGLGDWEYREVEAEIDLGSDDGVFEGMWIYREGCGSSGVVESVGPDSATARFVASGEDTGPHSGDRVSTRASWERHEEQ